MFKVVSPSLRLLLCLVPMSGCSSLTVRVVTRPRADQLTWHLTVIQEGSPKIWPINASWNVLGGTPADLRTQWVEVPFIDGVATAQCPRRSGLYQTQSCALGPYRDNDTRVTNAAPRVRVEPFANAKRERRGDTLIVSGLDELTRVVSFDEVKDVSMLELHIDDRVVEEMKVSASLERHGWSWDGNRWNSAGGATLGGRGLTCQPGREVELPLSSLHPAPWRLWWLDDARNESGIAERAQWAQWRDARMPRLLTEGTSRTATFVCPQQPGMLALETDGTHPELLFVQLFGLNR